MALILEEGPEAGSLRVCCAHCGYPNTHQIAAQVFMRSEDSKTGIAAFIDAGNVNVHTDMKYNPSARRDGIRITLTCESCDAITKLTIVQHKGDTIINCE